MRKLLILNIQNNKRFEIPLVTEEDRINNNNKNSNIISNIISNISNNNNNNDDDNVTTSMITAATTTNNNQDNGNCSGIRSIAVNPSNTLLAVGAGKPYQVTIYELPSFDPIAVFAVIVYFYYLFLFLCKKMFFYLFINFLIKLS